MGWHINNYVIDILVKVKEEKMEIKRMVILSLYTAIALIIFTIEAALPELVPIPGIKLGLANIITLFVLSHYSAKEALLVLLIRIFLASIFIGQIVSFLYSLCGGVLAWCGMVVVHKIVGKQYIYFTSIIGGVFHNVGQILAAFYILKLTGIFAYLPYLIISGIITGLFTGIVCWFVNKHIAVKLI